MRKLEANFHTLKGMFEFLPCLTYWSETETTNQAVSLSWLYWELQIELAGENEVALEEETVEDEKLKRNKLAEKLCAIYIVLTLGLLINGAIIAIWASIALGLKLFLTAFVTAFIAWMYHMVIDKETEETQANQ